MKSHLERNSCFDGEVGIQRYDTVRYPSILDWCDRDLGAFWTPQEVDVTKDRIDYEKLDDVGKRIFLLNLKRQILLDTKQARAPLEVFLPVTSVPEFEAAVMAWGSREAIHSRSYTHIIRGVLNDPSEVFDEIESIEEIALLAKAIDKVYDRLAKHNTLKEMKDLGFDSVYDEYEHKKAFYLGLVAANALEGVRFYVSFACSWAFAQFQELMEGNAKIIRLICKDENLHLKLTQQWIDILKKEDPDFSKIAEECKEEATTLYNEVIKQEKEWAAYLFCYGDIIGMNEEICTNYIDYIASNRARKIGLEVDVSYKGKNPMQWTSTWISGNSRQVALQESENDSYIIGMMKGSILEDRQYLKDIFENKVFDINKKVDLGSLGKYFT